MKQRNAVQLVLRLVCGGVVAALVFIGVGMLPGDIEGIYRGMGMECMCDSVNFMQFRDGRVIMFKSAHPPVDLIGRYEKNVDGSVAIFMSPFKEGASEQLIFTATPRLWFTRFRSADGASTKWDWKAPVFGTVKTTIRDQEVSSAVIKKDGAVVKIIYNSALEEIRTETHQPKSKTAEPSAAAEQPRAR